MKTIFLSKQGYLFRIISSLLQILIFSPISLILSYVVSSIVLEFFNTDTLIVFKTVFIVINLLWLLRNSFIKLSDNKVFSYDFIGKRKIIELDEINSLKIIDYKDLRKIVFSHSGNNPLISNASAFLLPIGKFIMFKNKFGRDVVIGVWNYKKLYKNLLIYNNSDLVSSEIGQSNYCQNNKNNFLDKKYNFIVKMPIKNHIITYFKHFPETVVRPLIFLLFIFFSFNRIGVKINPFILLGLYFINSLITYFLIVRIVVDTKNDTLRLKLFNDNNMNIVKIDNLSNLEYVNSANELVADEKDFQSMICTPYYKKSSDNLIAFENSKNIYVVLSVNKPDELYNLLKKYKVQY